MFEGADAGAARIAGAVAAELLGSTFTDAGLGCDSGLPVEGGVIALGFCLLGSGMEFTCWRGCRGGPGVTGETGATLVGREVKAATTGSLRGSVGRRLESELEERDVHIQSRLVPPRK